MALRQLEKTYDPKGAEERWYRFWMDHRYFHASVEQPGDPYVVVIPPPNITGSLHVGHALNTTLQDVLVRWRRMQGRPTLWVPGTDHAGIATQNVVERQLIAEGTTREALGRDRFVARVWQWRDQSGGTILEQLKRLGASCDWERLRFTMDDGLSKAVREVFVRLYEEGLIYRGERLINWCPRCLTALSDIEVEHEDTKGKLYHIAYRLADDPSTTLVVATTRPETMLGDTAVAVHPADARYRALIGKAVRLPLTTRDIPIIADGILVDREFGSGVVKITPAHDFNDFQAGERHQLPRVAILDAHARLDPAALTRAGVEESVIKAVGNMPILKARGVIEERLKSRGALVKIDDHKMAVGKCYRCKSVVEPYLSPQWFVKIQPLADPAIQVVEDGRVRIIPDGWVNNYLGWMRDIKDWCISRQIWWGHRIPAWYCRQCNETAIFETAATGARTYSFSAQAVPIVARKAPTHCPDCGQHDFIQDPDVLDTWFSSALWPFSTLGWPDRTPELQRFYPTSTLVTGLDILFFWVARMIMMGLKFMGDVPFRNVYIHALVRDAEGQKMSKSKGNVIDPLSVMETYGTDALRFTLASMASPGRDLRLAEERIEGYRNFANKLWNAARFILLHVDKAGAPLPAAQRSLPDRWMLSRLNRVIQDTNAALELYRFDQAAAHLYHFVWHEYCDWYLELAKPALQPPDSSEAARVRYTLLESIELVLRLLHPFMPFITEEIWQALPRHALRMDALGESITTRPYPQPVHDWDAPDAEAHVAALERAATLVRNARALLGYAPGKSLSVYAMATTSDDRDALGRVKGHLEHVTRSSVTLSAEPTWASHVLRLVGDGLTVGVAVESDVDVQHIVAQLQRQQADLEKERTRLEAKLANREFVDKAPAEVVAEHRSRLSLLTHEHGILTSSAAQLQAIARGTS